MSFSAPSLLLAVVLSVRLLKIVGRVVAAVALLISIVKVNPINSTLPPILVTTYVTLLASLSYGVLRLAEARAARCLPDGSEGK